MKYIYIAILLFSIFLFVNNWQTNSDANNPVNNLECENSFSTINSMNEAFDERYYVVGHAFGKHNDNNVGLSEKLLNFFKNENNINNHQLILTGDFIQNASLENFEIVSNQINETFDNYFLSLGNHEVGDVDSFKFVFKKDFHIFEKGNFIIIVANFSNSDWKPDFSAQEEINKKINSVNDRIIFLFSHQIFWLNDIDGQIEPNGLNLLEGVLDDEPLSWIENYSNNNFIVISGDYGMRDSTTFYCEKNDNVIYIANGIYDKDNDVILDIHLNNNNYFIKKVFINN